MERRSEAFLPFSGFTLRHMRFDTSHFCDGSAGVRHPSFGFVIGGRDTLVVEEETIKLGENGFFFLPEGARYRSHWTGDPHIEYVMIHLEAERNGVFERAPAAVPALSVPETGETLARVEKGLSGSEGDKLEAASLLFSLLSGALEALPARSRRPLSPPVEKAVAYLRENYWKEICMRDLAAHCFISESRLYHLFEKELRVTPLNLRNELRVDRAAAMLRRGVRSVNELLAATGFTSESHLRRLFREQTGMTLSDYRRAFE